RRAIAGDAWRVGPVGLRSGGPVLKRSRSRRAVTTPGTPPCPAPSLGRGALRRGRPAGPNHLSSVEGLARRPPCPVSSPPSNGPAPRRRGRPSRPDLVSTARPATPDAPGPGVVRRPLRFAALVPKDQVPSAARA